MYGMLLLLWRFQAILSSGFGVPHIPLNEGSLSFGTDVV